MKSKVNKETGEGWKEAKKRGRIVEREKEERERERGERERERD